VNQETRPAEAAPAPATVDGQPACLPLAALSQAGRAPALPLALALPGGGQFCLLSLLRVLPGRRYVGIGQWQGQTVFAKLLAGAKARRDFSAEAQGAAWLAGQGLPTPRLLGQGFADGQGWLFFECLKAGQSLSGLWQAAEALPLPEREAEQQALLAKALPLIARLHAKGLWQADLHLENLMSAGGRLWLVDGGGIRAQSPGQPLDRRQALHNLGVLFGQLPLSALPLLPKALPAYTPAVEARELPALERAIEAERAIRLKDFLKKSKRDCSLFSLKEDANGITIALRSEEAALAPLLADLDAFIEAGHIYKTGGAATVARVEAGGRAFVVKRCNIKNFRHWLGRCWRPSRAAHSWQEGWRLFALGIPTAKPLALVERRRFGLRGTAYLVTEFLEGENALAASLDETQKNALKMLMQTLAAARLAHGDLKGTNLIWQNGRWALIDLDAMHPCRCRFAFGRGHRRDWERLKKNWPGESWL
jgi:tRNA A-37 threonylcarbamoyl transferase component Bud32